MESSYSKKKLINYNPPTKSYFIRAMKFDAKQFLTVSYRHKLKASNFEQPIIRNLLWWYAPLLKQLAEI